MKLVEMSQSMITEALAKPESGMGYQTASARLTYAPGLKSGYLIAGAYFLTEENLTKTASAQASGEGTLVFSDLSEPEIEKNASLPDQARLVVLPELRALFKMGSRPTSHRAARKARPNTTRRNR